MKRVLLFDGQQLIGYEWLRNACRRIETFEPDESGRSALQAWLARAPRTPVQLLVDVIEEEFHADRVPHVLGPERSQLYQRTATRHFRNTEFRYITCQGRDRTGRRDDRVLVAGLTHPVALKQWLDVIAAAEVPLKGVYSLPLVGESLLPALPTKGAARVLLVSQQARGSLRQSYYENGCLRFSRQVPVRTESASEYAGVVATEIGQIVRFLENQRFCELDGAIHVRILADPNEHAGLREALDAPADMPPYQLVAPARVAQRLGLRGPDPGAYADLLFVQVLARRRRMPNHYGIARLRRNFLDQRVRLALRGLAAAGLLAALAVVGGTWLRGMVYEQATAEAAERERRFERLYEQRLSQIGEFEFQAVDVKNAVDRVDALAAGARTDPAAELKAIGAVVAQSAPITLQRLQWRLGSSQGGRQRTAAIDATGAATRSPVVRIEGEVDRFEGDFRLAIGHFEAFVDRLRAAGLGRVAVEEAPFDLAPDSGVSGDSGIGGSGGSQRRADFALELTFNAETDADG